MSEYFDMYNVEACSNPYAAVGKFGQCKMKQKHYSTFNSLLCHKSQFTGLTEEKKIRPGQKRTPIPLSPDSVPLTHYDQHQDSSPFTDYQHI